MQAGGDTVHCGTQGIVEGWIGRSICAGAFAAQQIDLDQAQRIDIGVAQANGAGEDGIFLQKIALRGDSLE